MSRFQGILGWAATGRLATVRVGLVVAVAVAACADERGGSSVALDALETKVEVVAFAGGEPARCVFSAPGLELCTWSLRSGDDAWAALAGDAEIAGDLNLLCELPIDGSPRAEGSCRAHPRSVHAASEAEGLPPVGAAGSLENRREAERRLGEALTVLELSHLIGDAPERCKTGSSVQTCEWSLAEGAAGYGLLASLVDDAGSGSTVRLRCVLPLDGAARSTDSCETAWSD